MSLYEQITSWDSLGMNWENPNPNQTKYWIAIEKALNQRTWIFYSIENSNQSVLTKQLANVNHIKLYEVIQYFARKISFLIPYFIKDPKNTDNLTFQTGEIIRKTDTYSSELHDLNNIYQSTDNRSYPIHLNIYDFDQTDIKYLNRILNGVYPDYKQVLISFKNIISKMQFTEALWHSTIQVKTRKYTSIYQQSPQLALNDLNNQSYSYINDYSAYKSSAPNQFYVYPRTTSTPLANYSYREYNHPYSVKIQYGTKLNYRGVASFYDQTKKQWVNKHAWQAGAQNICLYASFPNEICNMYPDVYASYYGFKYCISGGYYSPYSLPLEVWPQRVYSNMYPHILSINSYHYIQCSSYQSPINLNQNEFTINKLGNLNDDQLRFKTIFDGMSKTATPQSYPTANKYTVTSGGVIEDAYGEYTAATFAGSMTRIDFYYDWYTISGFVFQ